MESMLHIGNNDTHESAGETAEAIVSIFQGAREHTMDQHTVEKALEAFMHVAEVKNVTITNSQFTNYPEAPKPTVATDLEVDSEEVQEEE